MLEIRFHGRGGQGAVVASEMLASMYFESGKHVQAFPAFGVERRGAPVLAFTRTDNSPIEIHYGVYEPDRVIVLDETITEIIDVSGGLKKGGIILINSNKVDETFIKYQDFKVSAIDVNSIAAKYGLGTASLPIVNTAILGAYAAVSGDISVNTVKKIVFEYSPAKKEDNSKAAEEAFNIISNGS
ncbi:2-oxoacid:acceptor oxidoreductase family protein [candidate division KSB1 bacterium]